MNNKTLSSAGSFNLPLPSEFKSLAGLLLIPSRSLGEKVKKHLKDEGLQLSNGPLLADYCYPTLVSSRSLSCQFLLISPFLGHSGISFLLSLLLLQNPEMPILFFGSAGGINFNGNRMRSGLLLEPTCYSIEQDHDSLYPVPTNPEYKSVSGSHLLSTSEPLFENIQKIKSYHAQNNISLIDMECAYLAHKAQIAGVAFSSLILVSDCWDLDEEKHYLGRRPDKLEDVGKGLVRVKEFIIGNNCERTKSP